MQGFRNILDQWHELWRYPDLLVALEQADAEEPAAPTLATSLIDGLASPRPPRDCLLSLLQAGEFQAAERVLETAGFEAAIGPNDHEALFGELDEARRRAAEEVRARIAVLEARAGRVGLPCETPSGMDDVLERRVTAAQILLDGWEDEIRRREAEVASELQRSLEVTTGTIGEETKPGMAAWQASVERCLDAREYEAARFLVESGPGAERPDEPLVVPRRPRWPWNELLGELLQWFEGTRPSPPEFHARWRHDSTDMPAVRLLDVLGRIADSGIIDIDSARELADALDCFLGREEMDREVIARGNWFETRLHAPVDPRLPCFAPNDSVGVRFWVPRTMDAAQLDELADERSGLCFLPDENLPDPTGIVGFDPRSLLRLFAEREHRHLNFLRKIGGKIELEAVVPTDIDGIRLPPMETTAVRGYTAWVLDIVNIEVAGPAVVDVIVYYVGANPRLVLHLLRVLLGSMSSRRAVIGLDDVVRAWRTPVFRDGACSELLGSLDDRPLLRAALGAALYVGLRPGGLLSAEEVCMAIQMLSGSGLEEATARTSLDCLRELGLIDILEPNGSYRVPASGIGSILLDAIDDSEEYVKRALEVAERT